MLSFVMVMVIIVMIYQKIITKDISIICNDEESWGKKVYYIDKYGNKIVKMESEIKKNTMIYVLTIFVLKFYSLCY
jgi:S-adenosylmethionine hydrolase